MPAAVSDMQTIRHVQGVYSPPWDRDNGANICNISYIFNNHIGTFCKFSEKNIQALFREGSLYTGCQNDDIYINNA